MVKKIQDIFPILDIEEDGLIFTKNADLVYVYEINYPEVFKASEFNYTTCFKDLYQSIKNLGEGYMMHKQDFFIYENYTPNHKYNKNFDPILMKNEQMFEGRAYMNHKGYIYVILPNVNPDKITSINSSLFRKFLVKKEMKEADYLEEFKQRCGSFVESVNSANLFSLKKLKEKDILGSKEKPGLFNLYFSLDFDDTSLYDVDFKENINIGNHKMATYVMNDLDQYPQELPPVISFRDYSTDRTDMPASYGFNLGLNLRCNHIYNQILYIPKQQELKSKLTQDQKRHFSFSAWSRDNTHSLEQKTTFLDAIQQETIAVKAHFNIQVFNETETKLNKSKALVAAKIQQTGFLSKLAKVYSEQIFWSCIPGNAAEIGSDNLATVILDNAVAMMSMESNKKKSPFQSQGILMTDRWGKPILVDLFFEPREQGVINNRNFVVVGPSGSGKSFSMNNAIYYLLNQGAHITIVDIGDSYGRIGEILGAKKIQHTKEKPISLNPFYMDFRTVNETGEKLRLEEEFKDVVVATVALLFKNQDEKLSKPEDITIRKMVSSYYQWIFKNQKIYPCFDSFYEFVRDEFPIIFSREGGMDADFNIKQFLYVTSIFYADGDYGYLLNAKDETNYSKEPFVIYELDNIKDNPVLMPIMTLAITNTYISKLVGVKDTLKILMMEEAWRAVNNPTFAEFLLWAFKTARKHFGSIGVITQELEDLLKSEIIKKTIISNSDIKWIMDLSAYEDKQDEVCELFELKTSDLPIVFSINKSIGVQRGKFKESAIKLGKQINVYGNEVSKEAYGLFTTDPKEKDEILNISKKNGISQKDAALVWAEQQ